MPHTTVVIHEYRKVLIIWKSLYLKSVKVKLKTLQTFGARLHETRSEFKLV